MQRLQASGQRAAVVTFRGGLNSGHASGDSGDRSHRGDSDNDDNGGGGGGANAANQETTAGARAAAAAAVDTAKRAAAEMQAAAEVAEAARGLQRSILSLRVAAALGLAAVSTLHATCATTAAADAWAAQAEAEEPAANAQAEAAAETAAASASPGRVGAKASSLARWVGSTPLSGSHSNGRSASADPNDTADDSARGSGCVESAGIFSGAGASSGAADSWRSSPASDDGSVGSFDSAASGSSLWSASSGRSGRAALPKPLRPKPRATAPASSSFLSSSSSLLPTSSGGSDPAPPVVSRRSSSSSSLLLSSSSSSSTQRRSQASVDRPSFDPRARARDPLPKPAAASASYKDRSHSVPQQPIRDRPSSPLRPFGAAPAGKALSGGGGGGGGGGPMVRPSIARRSSRSPSSLAGRARSPQSAGERGVATEADQAHRSLSASRPFRFQSLRSAATRGSSVRSSADSSTSLSAGYGPSERRE